MAKLNNDLTKIITARNDMKSALASKGQTVTNDIRTYAEAISNIEGGLGDIQLYNSIATMEADQTMPEGMYGTVYGREEGPITEDAEFQQVRFPANVTVSSEVTGYISAEFQAVDRSVWASMYAMLNPTSCEIQASGDTGHIMIRYTSSDGIHYTRASETETYDAGTVLCFETYGSPFDDRIGQFILASVPVYNGLYQYNNYSDKDNIHLIPMNSLEFTSSSATNHTGEWDGTFTSETYNVSNLQAIVHDILDNEYTFSSSSYNYEMAFALDSNDSPLLLLMYNKSNNKISSSSASMRLRNK